MISSILLTLATLGLWSALRRCWVEMELGVLIQHVMVTMIQQSGVAQVQRPQGCTQAGPCLGHARAQSRGPLDSSNEAQIRTILFHFSQIATICKDSDGAKADNVCRECEFSNEETCTSVHSFPFVSTFPVCRDYAFMVGLPEQRR